MDREPDHPSSRRVNAALSEFGLHGRVRELSESTRTALDAALALGCEVRQIVKSLVFRTRDTGRPILVLAAGDHRVDEAWMARYTGEPLDRADPEFVRSATGFAIGGVPPVGHPRPLPTFIDFDLLEQSELWAAAGHPHAVFHLTSTELLEVSNGRPVAVVPFAAATPSGGPWVTFDCYGTLVDWRTGLTRALVEVLGPMPPIDADRIFDEYGPRERTLEAGPYRSYREVMAEALQQASRTVGHELSKGAAQSVVETIPHWPLFPDAGPTLEALHQGGRRVAILSNVDRDLLDRTLASHRLAVDVSISADEVRAYKPSLAHWVRFLKVTGASPGETWHVSGGYEYDIPPAAQLGFRTVYLHREKGDVLARKAAHQVRDLAALVPMISPAVPDGSDHGPRARPPL